jgi:HlyD family secretion protein
MSDARNSGPDAAAARDEAANMEELLGPGRGRRARRWWLWAAVAAAVAAAAAIAWLLAERAPDGPRYVTEAVEQGDLKVTVTANGTLAPTRSVNVGSELSGTVAKVFVDINDRVRKGQVLVELDTAKLRDQLSRSNAALASAQAKVAQTVATVSETRAKLARMEDVARASAGKVPSATELDAARAALERARADELAARASVADARAAVSQDTTNLSKASIRSPIDGIVLTRAVDPGNAVAASLQAVTLFTVAENLATMKLQVNVDEADVGKVRDGQSATFTVSAYPNRRYPARVTRVGYGSTTKDNVVTYLADLQVDNADLSLRPGMTATAVIAAAERKGVLLVPNAALRYTPGDAKQAPEGGIVSKLVPRAPRSDTPRRAGTTAESRRQVWVLRSGSPAEVSVTPGLTDGRRTEVVGNGLQVGDAVITDQISAPAK